MQQINNFAIVGLFIVCQLVFHFYKYVRNAPLSLFLIADFTLHFAGLSQKQLATSRAINLVPV